MPPGSKMQTPDGVIGIVMPNNNVQLQVPPNYQQRLLLQQRKWNHVSSELTENMLRNCQFLYFSTTPEIANEGRTGRASDDVRPSLSIATAPCPTRRSARGS